MTGDDIQAEVDLRLAVADAKRLDREIKEINTEITRLEAKREKLQLLRDDQVARAYDLMREKEQRKQQ